MTDTLALTDLPEPCDQCRDAGPSCGSVVPPDALPRPCVRCKMPTRVRSRCGAPRHFHCEHWSPVPVIVPPASLPPEDRPVCANHGPDVACTECVGDTPVAQERWIGQRVARERAAGRATAVQPHLVEFPAVAELDVADQKRAVALWNANMRGLTYQGGHRTALAILTGTLKHRSIPALPEACPAELVAPGEGKGWGARAWLVPGHEEGLGRAASTGMSHVAGYDVNGMYLGAADIDLGIGYPERVDNPGDEHFRYPGWVRVAAMEGAPHGIQERWSEGMWMRTELVRYLVDTADGGAGATVLADQAVIQRQARRWLKPHVALFREARKALIDDGTPAGRAVLAVVKDIYTRMLGGLLDSGGPEGHNPTNTMRPWWKAAIVATGQARMFRALGKVQGEAVLIGVYVDAAWFVLPRSYAAPVGLTLDPVQLGKWKPAGRTSWTPELSGAYRTGNTRALWKALHDAPDTDGA